MWLAIRQCRPGNCSRATGVAGRVDRAARELCSLDNLVVSLIARDLGLTSVPVFAIVENFTQCLDAMLSRQLRFQPCPQVAGRKPAWFDDRTERHRHP
jgi:hypothetical protein